jgi:hypothetical protein
MAAEGLPVRATTLDAELHRKGEGVPGSDMHCGAHLSLYEYL